MANKVTERGKTSRFRDFIFVRDLGRCRFCLEPVIFISMLQKHGLTSIQTHTIELIREGVTQFVRIATVEHLFPVGRGGRTTLNNLALACSQCNTQRNEEDNWRATHYGPQ